jgi:GNAT superfamily N-acetyltransferase
VITVSTAEPGDAAAIAALLTDLGRFYGTRTPVGADQVAEAIFTAPPAGYALVARDGGQLAGLAAYSFLWPAIGASRSLFLKELYVPEAYRRRGVGRLLMRAVFEAATGHGCSRVEWTTDPGNAEAQAFYARLGRSVHPKVFYRATL